MNQPAQTPSFSIEKLYMKDLSVEVPNAPEVYLQRETPQVEIQLQTNGRKITDDGIYEVSLTVTVTARHAEKTVFLIEANQGGVFRILNVPDDAIEPIIAVACPNILFPYVREAVSDATTRAGFSPVVLQPVNFEAMYMARMDQEDAAAGASGAHEVPVQ